MKNNNRTSLSLVKMFSTEITKIVEEEKDEEMNVQSEYIESCTLLAIERNIYVDKIINNVLMNKTNAV